MLGRILRIGVAGEWLAAFAATIAAIYLHVGNARWAGALWRDEAHTAAAAMRPSVREIWNSLGADNFPLLSTLIVRIWGWSEWGRSDTGLRSLGALIGIGILAVLWFNGWRINRGPPTIALAVWAFNPIAIRYGDSIRPYGCGMLLQLSAAGAMLSLARAPSWPRFACAALACTLCVQCLYQNAILVLAFGLAGCVVAARIHHYRNIIPVLSAGAVAALSLLPYLRSIREARDWAELMVHPPSDSKFWLVLSRALGGDSRVVFWLVVFLVLSTSLATLLCLAPRQFKLNRDAAERSIYAIVAGALGAAGFCSLLGAMGVRQQSWHFLPVLATIAFTCDAVLGHARAAAAVRVTVLIVVVLASWKATVAGLQLRQTNIDSIAALLQESADPEDLIVVQPWFYGVTFSRYYHGDTPWMSLPDLSDLSVHRYDLAKRAMATPDAVDRVMQRITSTLLSGHRVWIIGGVPRLPAGYLYGTTPTAPHPEYGWQHPPYIMACGREVAAIIDRLASQKMEIDVPGSASVNDEENVKLGVAGGWKR
jgi:hypothetical protein